jgi:hypothetical protein
VTPQELVEKIAALSPEQREAVGKFVIYLQEKTPAPANARAAIDAFMNEHAELMRLLAQ